MHKREVKQYTVEFKKASAKLATDATKSIAKTAKDLGVNVNTLHGWVNKYASKIVNRTPSKSELDPDEEIKRLRKQIVRLTQERDILKNSLLVNLPHLNRNTFAVYLN